MGSMRKRDWIFTVLMLTWGLFTAILVASSLPVGPLVR